MWLLHRRRGPLRVFDRIVLARECEGLAAEKALDDLKSFFKAFDPFASWVVRNAGSLVVGDQPAGAQAQVQPAVGQKIERRRLFREHPGIDRKSTRLNSSHVAISYA